MYKNTLLSVFMALGLALLILILYSGKKQSTAPTTIESGAEAPVVVLELFTSQGCSSCPPADKLLDEAKNRFPNEVIALSYHVDYWNYIGWEDPFSQSVFTKKQSIYNRKFGYRGNYTPEMVVNGREHFVGSNRSKLFSKIDFYGGKGAEQKISLRNVSRTGSKIDFDYAVEGNTERSELRAVLVLNERVTSVKRGENRNRTLKNSNIVLTEKYLKLDDAGKGSIAIPPIVVSKDELTLVLLVENDALDITAATKRKV